MRSRWTTALLVAGMWVLAVVVYLRSPGRVPTHWNAHGEIDRWGAPESVFILPAVAMALALAMAVLPRIDPKRANWQKFGPEVRVITNVLVMFLAWVLIATTGGYAFGWKIDEGRTTLAGLGLLLMVIGNYLPRIRSNWWMGIRTPWTLTSDRVWRETHRLGGRTFVAAGLLSVLSALALPDALGVTVSMVAVLAGALVPVVYSFWVWRRETTGR